MKKLYFLFFIFHLLLFAGCQESAKKFEPPITVVINGDGNFPSFIAGRWIGDKYNWEIVFEPNGVVSSAVIPMGAASVKPGETTIIPLIKGGRGIYNSGKWSVEYSPATGELAVNIVINAFDLQAGDESIRGSLNEYLVGKISPDGWEAEWITVPTYIVTTAEYKDYTLPIDDNEPSMGTVLFLKESSL